MTNKPYILLVGVDFSELSDRALHEAFAQASQRANSEVHVLSVLPVAGEDPGYGISVYATLDEKPILDAALQRLRTHVELELESFGAAHPDAPIGLSRGLACARRHGGARHRPARLASRR